MENIEPAVPKVFISYPYMIVIMAVLQIMTIIYGARDFLFFGFNVAVGGVIFVPALFYTFQIVSEVYGWQYARQIFWCNFIVNVFTTISYYLVRSIPYNDFTKIKLKFSYVNLMDTMWLSSISWGLGVFLAQYITSVVMSKSRITYKGRFVAIRLVFMHCMSEVLLFLGLSVSLPYNGYSATQIIHLFGTAFCARTIMAIMLLPFAVILVYILQYHVEKVVVFDSSSNFFNIFQWNVKDKNTVTFNIKDWRKLSQKDRKNLDIKKVTQEYRKTHTLINIRTSIKPKSGS